MASPHHQTRTQLSQRFNIEVRGWDNAAHVHHHRIELAAAQLQDLQLYRPLGDRHAHACPGGRCAHQRHQQERRRARAQPHADAAPATVLQQLGALAQLCRLANNVARPGHHILAQRRELIAFANAVQHLGAQVNLQALDAAAERRLRQKQFLGRAAERARVSQGQQVFQVLDVHAGTRPF